MFAATEINLNTLLIVIGWLVGGIVVVVGMRTQMAHLANEIGLLRTTLTTITARIDTVDKEVAYLRGRADGRREILDERVEGKGVT